MNVDHQRVYEWTARKNKIEQQKQTEIVETNVPTARLVGCKEEKKILQLE